MENKVNRLCVNLIYLLNEEEFELETEITADHICYNLKRPIIELEENEEVINLINTILAKDQIEINNIAIEAIDCINRNLF